MGPVVSPKVNWYVCMFKTPTVSHTVQHTRHCAYAYNLDGCHNLAACTQQGAQAANGNAFAETTNHTTGDHNILHCCNNNNSEPKNQVKIRGSGGREEGRVCGKFKSCGTAVTKNSGNVSQHRFDWRVFGANLCT